MSWIPSWFEYVDPVTSKSMFVILSGWTAADRNQASSLTLFLEVEHLFIIMLFVILDVMRISKRVLLLINAKLIQLIVRLTRQSPTAG